MDWKKNRVTFAVGILALMIGFAIFAISKRNKEDSSGVIDEVEITLPKFEADKITAVTLKNPEHGKTVLVKIDDAWRVKEPIDWPADESNVKYLTEKLQSYFE